MGPSSAFPGGLGMSHLVSKKLEKPVFLLLFLCVVVCARGLPCSSGGGCGLRRLVVGRSSGGRRLVVGGWSSAGRLQVTRRSRSPTITPNSYQQMPVGT